MVLSAGIRAIGKGVLCIIPPPLGNTEIKHTDEYSEELKELIENNKINIFKDIRKVVSINLSTQIINRLYDSFINSHAYTYKSVTKYNIPYAMLYYQQSICKW